MFHAGITKLLPVIVAAFQFQTSVRAEDKPNFILIFTDDQGYADLSCYGSKTIKTPNIDSLAKDGLKFTNFSVAAAICTPSRAALMTGCYPKRIDMHKGVLMPSTGRGLSPDEYTIADHLKAQGYATKCIGKWHLGSNSKVLPTANGFDSYFGIPYSNDMNHEKPTNPSKGGGPKMDGLWKDPGSSLTAYGTPLMENEKIIECPVDQRTLTRRYTQSAIDFVTTNKNQPFFIYLAHTMPHVPLYVPDDVRDPDPKKAYANTIEHLDAEVGRLLKALDELNLSKKTYIIFTSDNGPWLKYDHHAGSAFPLRDGKMSIYEGGVRVPCLIRGPGIRAGTVTDAFSCTMDILPTIAEIIAAPLPKDRKIDGMNSWSLWNGTAKEVRKEFVYYAPFGSLKGIRQGDWKLIFNDKGDGSKGSKSEGIPEDSEAVLYDLGKDISETTNLASQHPDLVKTLKSRMIELDEEITKNSRPCWPASEKGGKKK
jgi:arylsulfatase A